MFKRFALCFLILSTLVIFSSSGFASFEPSPWTTEPLYNQKMAKKFMFGFSNLTWGWLEIFKEPYQAVSENRMVWPAIGVGLFNGIVDTIGGALQVLTSPVTPLDIPLPEGGVWSGSKWTLSETA